MCPQRHCSAVASPVQKVGGPNNFSSLVNSKTIQYTCMGPGPPPPIYKTLINGFAQISGGV